MHSLTDSGMATKLFAGPTIYGLGSSSLGAPRLDAPDDLEALRSKELERYRMSNGPSEPALERLANLAATLANTPLAIITFACGEHLILHASCGATSSLIETVGGRRAGHNLWHLPRASSFCECVLSSNEFVQFSDLSNDARFAGSPVVSAPDSDETGVRFYAGAPLRSANGLAIGAIAVIDREARELTPTQSRALEELAVCVMDALEARVARLHSAQMRNQREAQWQLEVEAFQAKFGQLMRHNSQLQAAVCFSSVGIVITDPDLPDNPIIYANPAFEKITGYPRDEIVGFNCRFLRGPATNPETVAQMRAAISEQRPFRATLLNYRKDGTPFWNELTLNPIHDESGRLVNYIGVQSDVSERMENEAAVYRAHDELEVRVRLRTQDLENANAELSHSREELRALAAHLDTVQEGERARIAREIHDDLGQQLSGLKMELARCCLAPDSASGAPHEPDGARVAAMNATLDEAIASVRRIASDLRPAVLDRCGLLAALEWQTSEWARQAGARFSFSSNLSDATIGHDRANAIYRITQEALTNVARHASASRVTVSLRESAGKITLLVKDNGRGIAASETLCAANLDGSRATPSLGLVGMEERALLLGGRLTVKPNGGKARGTTVSLVLPAERRKRGAINEGANAK